MQGPVKGLVTAVRIFLLPTPTRACLLDLSIDKEPRSYFCKILVVFVQETLTIAMILVTCLLQFQRRNVMTY